MAIALERAQRRSARRIIAVIVLALMCSRPVVAVNDVLLQTMNGKIITGIVDDQTFMGTLGTRVFRQQFLANFRSANPGFVALATGNPNLPSGVAGFPSNHDVNFDLLPMTSGPLSTNLLYWDGGDLDGDGLDLDDVLFVKPDATSWEVFDAGFDMYVADGTDQPVAGGLIQRTSSDIDPQDGIDTGSIHKHLAMQLSDDDGNPATTPAEGVYMIAWQARATGFEPSAPFLFVLRTSMVADTVRDLAANWAVANLDVLTLPPATLPGDYNGDGAVDAADYVVWRETIGSTTDLRANGDNIGASENLIDEADYVVWRANFGANQASAAALATASAVPEPSRRSHFYCRRPI